jgi:hypothetical protein
MEVYNIDGSSPLLTVEELTEYADDVVVARASGRADVHWNNRANAEWGDPSALLSMILHDEHLSVTREGNRTGGEITIRQLGGTIGNVTFENHEAREFAANEDLLLFLRWADTPTQEGSERMLTVVGPGIGTFRLNSGGNWENVARQVITPQEVDVLLSGH